jgi:hypothetical protein
MGHRKFQGRENQMNGSASWWPPGHRGVKPRPFGINTFAFLWYGG